MLAGEGLGGVAQALLAIIGVDGGSKHPHVLAHFPHTDNRLSFAFRVRHCRRLPWHGVLRLNTVLLLCKMISLLLRSVRLAIGNSTEMLDCRIICVLFSSIIVLHVPSRNQYNND